MKKMFTGFIYPYAGLHSGFCRNRKSRSGKGRSFYSYKLQ